MLNNLEDVMNSDFTLWTSFYLAGADGPRKLDHPIMM